MQPTIDRIVHYKSKIDNGPGGDVVSPAIVIRTRATTVPAVIERWGPTPRTVASASDPTVTHETAARPDGVVAELPDDTVDLIVFGLGQTYREYAVPYGQGRGQWSYPERRGDSMIHDYLISLIRTGVPAGIGALLAWLASQAGIVLDADSSTALTAGVVALTGAGYYALVRALESRWPRLGVLLGTPAAPTYKVDDREAAGQ